MLKTSSTTIQGYSLKIGLAALILLALGFTIWKIKFGFGLDEFHHKGSQEYRQYLEHKNTFHTGQDERMILIVLHNQNGIFDQNFLQKADELTKYIDQLPEIAKVFSLTNTHQVFFKDGSVEARPLIRIDQPTGYRDDSVGIEQAPDFREFLVSASRKSIAIAAYYKEESNQKDVANLLDSLESKIGQLKFDRTVLSSKYKTERDFGLEIKNNFIRFTLLSAFVAALILLFSLGSLVSTLVALLIIAVPVVLILQIIMMTENQINIIQTFSIPIITSLGLSHLIHLTASLKNNISSGIQRDDAFKKALKDIYPAMLLTTLTTGIGYIGLVSIDIAPVRNFGWITGLVSVISLYLVMDVMKIYKSELAGTPKPYLKSEGTYASKNLSKIYLKAIRYKYAILAVFLSLTVLMTYYTSKISLEGRLIEELPKNHNLRQDYSFLEQEFCGTRDFEMHLTALDSAAGFLNPAMLYKLDDLENYLRDSLGACMLISPVPMIKAANRAYQGGVAEQFALPDNQALINQYSQSILQTQYAEEWNSHVANSGQKIRISGKLTELSIRQFEALAKKLDAYFKNERLDQYFSFHLTGKAVVLDEMAMYLGQKLFLSLAITLIMIMAVMWWSWKSARLAGIAMIALSVSILFMGGLMGLMGIPLKPDTALIFCLASGIAVDGTIHLINRWRALRKGSEAGNLWIMLRVYQSAGMTIFMHSLIMLSGFSCLLFSSLPGAFNFGLLITFCLLVALIINMALLPFLMILKK